MKIFEKSIYRNLHSDSALVGEPNVGKCNWKWNEEERKRGAKRCETEVAIIDFAITARSAASDNDS